MKLKKIAIVALAAMTMATSVAGMSASAYSYGFNLGAGQSGYTTTYSRGGCSYGTVKDSGHASSSSYYTAAFCNSSYSPVSYSAIINNSSKHQLDYYAYPSSACLRISNTATAQTCTGNYNPNGAAYQSIRLKVKSF